MILYIDPSVMNYAIQALVGVVIAVGAFVGVYYRKAKKKINNKLGIDENRNKEVESDEIVVAEEETPKKESKTTKPKTANTKTTNKKSTKKKK